MRTFRLVQILIIFNFIFLESIPARSLVDACPEVTGKVANLVVQTPGFQYTITNFDPSWFDMDHPENAPTLFTLMISDALKPYAGKLRLRIQVLADTSRGKNINPIIAFDRITTALDITKIGLPLRSQDVFGLSFNPGLVLFKDSPLYDLIAHNHVAPEMNLLFRFNLTCETDDNVIATTQTVVQLGNEGKLRYVKMIQALYPGTPITNPTAVPIYTLSPIFKVASELFNSAEFIYPSSENKIEIFLYELPPGVLPSDAMDGLEYAKFGVSTESPIAYPPNQPRLRPGTKYIWRARALLRGPSSDYLYSNPLYFKLDERLEGGSSVTTSELSDLRSFEGQVKYGDDYSKRVMAALKIILADNYEIFDLSRTGKIPAKGQIRLNGHPYSLEELERLAREFHQSKQSLTRLRFQ